MSYHFPRLGTRLPGQKNKLKWPAKNIEDDVLAYQQAAAQEAALNATDSDVENYLGTIFPLWLSNYKIGGIAGIGGLLGDPEAPPPPPPLETVAVLVASDGGRAVLIYEEEGSFLQHVRWDIQKIGPAACEVPDYDLIPFPDDESAKRGPVAAGRPSAPQHPQTGKIRSTGSVGANPTAPTDKER